jgi:hypothetical protein
LRLDKNKMGHDPSEIRRLISSHVEPA